MKLFLTMTDPITSQNSDPSCWTTLYIRANFAYLLWLFHTNLYDNLGIFSVAPPTEPCALRSTQPLKVSTTVFSWGKGGRCFWLTTYHHCSAETSRTSEVLTYPEPLGSPRPVAGDLYFTLWQWQLSWNMSEMRKIIQLWFTTLVHLVRLHWLNDNSSL